MDFHTLMLQAGRVRLDITIAELRDLELRTRATEADAAGDAALGRMLKAVASWRRRDGEG